MKVVSPTTLLVSTWLLMAQQFAVVVDGAFSIVAMDLETQQIGGILATCLATDDTDATVETIITNASLVVVPCVGGIMAHGWWELNNQDVAPIKSTGETFLQAMNVFNDTAQDVLDAMANAQVDGDTIRFSETFSSQLYKVRQYGAVTPFSAATYSGEDLENVATFLGFAGAQVYTDTEQDDRIIAALQGNLIPPIASSDRLLEAFSGGNATANEDQCVDLPQMLINAMLVFDALTGGDVRCDNHSLAFMRVVGPTGDVQLDLSVHLSTEQADTGLDAVRQLNADFVAWRTDNPCGTLSERYLCPGFTTSPTSAPTPRSLAAMATTVGSAVMSVLGLVALALETEWL